MTDWITVREAAQILGVHMSAVPKMIRRGDLAKREQRPILSRADVDDYRDARLAAVQARDEERDLASQLTSPAPPDMEHDWLLAEAAGAVMGISRVAVNARARRGRLPSVVAGGRRWYRRDHLELILRAEEAKRRGSP
ncbi:helix-turn-helix domain-containing protein [Nocardioides xinjiangensis]|uniref:helix-turn-helix domain-containing protein n=1 Tax=Nocardioides xinjiangensis TaxID=2817376 RepID=UPI001B315024|nr:helix-turn-helix domain-containing protein [Nocardioides sp. SYSU D00778]